MIGRNPGGQTAAGICAEIGRDQFRRFIAAPLRVQCIDHPLQQAFGEADARCQTIAFKRRAASAQCQLDIAGQRLGITRSGPGPAILFGDLLGSFKISRRNQAPDVRDRSPRARRCIAPTQHQNTRRITLGNRHDGRRCRRRYPVQKRRGTGPVAYLLMRFGNQRNQIGWRIGARYRCPEAINQSLIVTNIEKRPPQQGLGPQIGGLTAGESIQNFQSAVGIAGAQFEYPLQHHGRGNLAQPLTGPAQQPAGEL